MKATVPRSAIVLAFFFGAWWLTRDHGPPVDPSAASFTEEGLDRVMVGKLELAVASAANAAECGYTDEGLGYREPEEAARRLVALMRSASGPAPTVASAGEVQYVVGGPQEPWQVAVQLEPDASALMIEGYGPDLTDPMFIRRIPCS